MSLQTELLQLQQQRASLLKQLANIGDFRPGTLSEYYRRCGKKKCSCAHTDDKHKWHGPHWMVTRKVERKTTTRAVPAAALEETRAQLARYQQFKDLLRQLTEVSDRLCHLKVKVDTSAKKGALQKA